MFFLRGTLKIPQDATVTLANKNLGIGVKDVSLSGTSRLFQNVACHGGAKFSTGSTGEDVLGVVIA